MQVQKRKSTAALTNILEFHIALKLEPAPQAEPMPNRVRRPRPRRRGIEPPSSRNDYNDDDDEERHEQHQRQQQQEEVHWEAQFQPQEPQPQPPMSSASTLSSHSNDEDLHLQIQQHLQQYDDDIMNGDDPDSSYEDREEQQQQQRIRPYASAPPPLYYNNIEPAEEDEIVYLKASDNAALMVSDNHHHYEDEEVSDQQQSYSSTEDGETGSSDDDDDEDDDNLSQQGEKDVEAAVDPSDSDSSRWPFRNVIIGLLLAATAGLLIAIIVVAVKNSDKESSTTVPQSVILQLRGIDAILTDATAVASLEQQCADQALEDPDVDIVACELESQKVVGILARQRIRRQRQLQTQQEQALQVQLRVIFSLLSESALQNHQANDQYLLSLLETAFAGSTNNDPDTGATTTLANALVRTDPSFATLTELTVVDNDGDDDDDDDNGDGYKNIPTRAPVGNVNIGGPFPTVAPTGGTVILLPPIITNTAAPTAGAIIIPPPEPTAAPTPEPCRLCDSVDSYVGNANGRIEGDGVSLTCRQAEEAAASLGDEQCAAIQALATEPCGCTEPNDAGDTITVTTTAPAATAIAAPTAASMPASAPTPGTVPDVPTPDGTTSNNSAATSWDAVHTKLETLLGVSLNDTSALYYLEALQWMRYTDPLQLAPDLTDPLFFQRLFLAYWYYATSAATPWPFCGPPAASEVDTCIYQKLVATEPIRSYTELPWVRFLSNRSECQWVGVFCNAGGIVEALDFCECCYGFCLILLCCGIELGIASLTYVCLTPFCLQRALISQVPSPMVCNTFLTCRVSNSITTSLWEPYLR